MTPRGRAASALVLVLLLAALCGAQVHAPDASPGKVILGRPSVEAAFQLLLAADFALPLPSNAGAAAPANSSSLWWCSECRAAEDASLAPEAPRLLLGAARATTLAQIGVGKNRPVVMSTRDFVLVCAVAQTLVKDLSREELAFARAWAGTPRGDLDAHASAHLWLWRMLRLQAHFEALLGLNAAPPRGALPAPGARFGHGQRGEVYLFADIEAYRAFGRHHFGSSGARTSWWFHQGAGACVAAQCVGSEGSAEESARFDHSMAHQCFFMYREFLYHLPAWVHEGLGAWFERRHKVHGATFCLLGAVQGWNTDIGDDWWAQLKLRVQTGKDEAVVPFSQRSKQHELPPELHPQAWALTAYLIGLGPQRYRVFLDTLKKQRAEESTPELLYRAVETAYGCDLVSLQDNWRAWVKGLKGKP